MIGIVIIQTKVVPDKGSKVTTIRFIAYYALSCGEVFKYQLLVSFRD